MGSEYDEVHDQVIISNINAIRMQSFDVDAVIGVCQDDVSDNVGVPYEHFNMADGEVDKYGGSSSYDRFEDAASTLLTYLRAEDTIAVHCHAGQSRSSSTAAAAIGVYEEQTYYQTIGEMKEKRPQIHPARKLEKHAINFIEDHTDIRHRPSGFYE